MKTIPAAVVERNKTAKDVDEHLTAISYSIIEDRQIAKDLRNYILAQIHMAREKMELVEKESREMGSKIGALERRHVSPTRIERMLGFRGGTCLSAPKSVP